VFDRSIKQKREVRQYQNNKQESLEKPKPATSFSFTITLEASTWVELFMVQFGQITEVRFGSRLF
jgi:hypothetical protein